MRRKLNLISSFLIMLCLGSIYAWSVFVPELISRYGLTVTQTQFIFGSVIGIFPLTMIWAARLNKNYGPRFVATLSGLLYFTGFLVAFLSRGNFFILWLGIGLLGGMGTGMGYLVSLSIPAKWYPGKKGLATGIVVGGFGAGAIILTYFSEFLLIRDVDVLKIFLYAGLFYGIIILISAQNLRKPAILAGNLIDFPYNKQPGLIFFQLGLGIFSGTFTGLLIIGNLKPIAQMSDIPALFIPFAISLLAAANFMGRIIWGWLSDMITNTYLIPTAILTQAIAALLLTYIPLTTIAFIFLVFIIGFCFGANFVLFARDTIQKYGIDHYERIYPFVFLGYALAGLVGPFSGGWAYDLTGSYLPAIIFSFLISLVASTIYVVIQIRYNKY